MIIRTGTLSSGSSIISGLKYTHDIRSGLFVYGSGIKVETYVESIDSSTQITLSKPVTSSGNSSLWITTMNPGIYFEAIQTLNDIKNIVDERGDIVQVIMRSESEITRDAYNSIKKRDQETRKFFMNACPVEFNPSQKKLEEAGIREESQVIIGTSMKDWIDLGIEFREIEMIRTTVKLQNEVYEVRDKALSCQKNDLFLKVNLGLFKK